MDKDIPSDFYAVFLLQRFQSSYHEPILKLGGQIKTFFTVSGFIQLREKFAGVPKLAAQAVLHEFFQVHLVILTLRLDKELEGEVALLLILDHLESRIWNQLPNTTKSSDTIIMFFSELGF